MRTETRKEHVAVPRAEQLLPPTNYNRLPEWLTDCALTTSRELLVADPDSITTNLAGLPPLSLVADLLTTTILSLLPPSFRVAIVVYTAKYLLTELCLRCSRWLTDGLLIDLSADSKYLYIYVKFKGTKCTYEETEYTYEKLYKTFKVY